MFHKTVTTLYYHSGAVAGILVVAAEIIQDFPCHSQINNDIYLLWTLPYPLQDV